MNRRTHTTHIIITNFSAKQNSLSSSFYYFYYSYSYSYSYRCSFRFTTIQTTTIAKTTASSSSSLFAPLPAPLIISSASRWPRARLYLIFPPLRHRVVIHASAETEQRGRDEDVARSPRRRVERHFFLSLSSSSLSVFSRVVFVFFDRILKSDDDDGFPQM